MLDGYVHLLWSWDDPSEVRNGVPLSSSSGTWGLSEGGGGLRRGLKGQDSVILPEQLCMYWKGCFPERFCLKRVSLLRGRPKSPWSCSLTLVCPMRKQQQWERVSSLFSSPFPWSPLSHFSSYCGFAKECYPRNLTTSEWSRQVKHQSKNKPPGLLPLTCISELGLPSSSRAGPGRLSFY